MDEKQNAKRALYYANVDGVTSWHQKHGAVDDGLQGYYDDRRVLSGVDPGDEYGLEERRALFNFNLNKLERDKVEFDMIKGAMNMAVPRTDKGDIADSLGIKDFEEEYYKLLSRFKGADERMQELERIHTQREHHVEHLKENITEEKNRRRKLEEAMDELRSKYAKVSYHQTQLEEQNTHFATSNKSMTIELKECREELAQLKEQLARDTHKDYHTRVTNWANEQLANCSPFLGITFGNEPKNGTYIRSCNPKQAAYGSGLREGDIISELNDQPTRTKQEFYKNLHGIRTGEVFKVKIFRPATGFFDVDDGDIAAREVLSSELAHKPQYMEIRMGAHEMSYDKLLSTLRLGKHQRDPSLYTDMNTASSFAHDVKVAGYSEPVDL